MSKRIHVLINGEQYGPYPEKELRQHVADTKILGNDLLWREGMPEWLAVSEFLAILDAAAATETAASPAGVLSEGPEPAGAEAEGPAELDADSLEALRDAATAGDLEACAQLGQLLMDAGGDPTEGLLFLMHAGEAGHMGSQYALGFRHANGLGVPQNDVEAVNWFRKAAQQGHTIAMCSVAYMIEEGRGAARNMLEVTRFYEMAAERGDAVAQNNLAMMLAAGRGVPKNERDAAKWFGKAARQNVAGAQMNYGLMLARGHGVACDPVEAYKWLTLAAAQGHAAAGKNRELLAVTMTSDQALATNLA